MNAPKFSTLNFQEMFVKVLLDEFTHTKEVVLKIGEILRTKSNCAFRLILK